MGVMCALYLHALAELLVLHHNSSIKQCFCLVSLVHAKRFEPLQNNTPIHATLVQEINIQVVSKPFTSKGIHQTLAYY